MASDALVRRRCACCKRYLPLTEFYLDYDVKDGYSSYCRDCKRPTRRFYRNTKEGRKRYKSMGDEYNPRFEGIKVPITHCPRCGMLLVDEGEMYYCKYGCTRTFLKDGGSVIRAYEQEQLVAVTGWPWGLHLDVPDGRTER